MASNAYGGCYLYQASIQVLCHHEEAQFKDEDNFKKLTHTPQTNKGKTKYRNNRAFAHTLTPVGEVFFSLLADIFSLLVKVMFLVSLTLSCAWKFKTFLLLFSCEFLQILSSSKSAYWPAGPFSFSFSKLSAGRLHRPERAPKHPSKSQQRLLAEILTKNCHN